MLDMIIFLGRYLIYRSAARLTRFHRGLKHKEVGLRDLESIKIGLQSIVSPVTEVDLML